MVIWHDGHRKTVGVAAGLVLTLFLICLICKLLNFKGLLDEPEIVKDDLSPNYFSRPCLPLEKRTGIVIHYVANPGSTAKGNRDYFEQLRFSGDTYASCHFVIGLEGEIVQCIPVNEVAYCSNDRNYDTIAIEVCHYTDEGRFTKESYGTLVQLSGWLCRTYHIAVDSIIRHYDVTGKRCPKYFVEHPWQWIKFKSDVAWWCFLYSVVN